MLNLYTLKENLFIRRINKPIHHSKALHLLSIASSKLLSYYSNYRHNELHYNGARVLNIHQYHVLSMLR